MSQSFSAPAKIILFGEHAVVYGQPAIAVPVSGLRAYADLEASTVGLQLIAEDLNETVVYDPVSEHVLAQTVRLFLEKLGVVPPNVTLRLHSQIPMASGLGSGTAISTVIGRALSAAVGIVLPDNDLNAIVYEVEKIHHGTPSGIDNTAIVYEQPVFFRRDRPIERIVIKQNFPLIVADTGLPALTKVAVGDLRRLYNESPDSINPILEEIGQLVFEARLAVENGNLQLLGTLMRRNHQFLRQLTVSSPELDQLVNAAQEAGALGAKLSGGGRGGNLIAVAEPDDVTRVMQALLETGAARVFSTDVVG